MYSRVRLPRNVRFVWKVLDQTTAIRFSNYSVSIHNYSYQVRLVLCMYVAGPKVQNLEDEKEYKGYHNFLHYLWPKCYISHDHLYSQACRRSK